MTKPATKNRDQVGQTLTVPEVAERLRIGRNAAYDAIKRGEIPSIRIGKRILVSCVAFDQFLAVPKGPGNEAA